MRPLHPEELIGNACADSASVALSFDSQDAPVLDPHLYQACTSLLIRLSSEYTKFGKSDNVNPPRVMKSTKASGICLAATTTAISSAQGDTGSLVSV